MACAELQAMKWVDMSCNLWFAEAMGNVRNGAELQELTSMVEKWVDMW